VMVVAAMSRAIYFFHGWCVIFIASLLHSSKPPPPLSYHLYFPFPGRVTICSGSQGGKCMSYSVIGVCDGMSGYVWMNGLKLDRVTEFWAWWSTVLLPAFPHPLLQLLAFLVYLLLMLCNSVGHFWGSLPVLKISPCFLLGKEVEMAPECV